MVIREQRESLQEFRRHAVLLTHRSGRLKRQVKSVLCRMECPLLSLHNIKGVAVHKAYLLALRHPDKVSGNVHPGARL